MDSGFSRKPNYGGKTTDNADRQNDLEWTLLHVARELNDIRTLGTQIPQEVDKTEVKADSRPNTARMVSEELLEHGEEKHGDEVPPGNLAVASNIYGVKKQLLDRCRRYGQRHKK